MNISTQTIMFVAATLGTVSIIFSLPPEVAPLAVLVPAGSSTTVVDHTQLGQSLTIQREHITTFQLPQIRTHLLDKHQDLAEMLQVITTYINVQGAWLPPAFVAAWEQLLSRSITPDMVPCRGAGRNQLADSITEVVTTVSQATEAVVKAVTACMKLLKQLGMYVGLTQTRAVHQLNFNQQHATKNPVIQKKGWSPAVIGLVVVAAVLGIGGLTACAVSLATSPTAAHANQHSRLTVSSYQHRNYNVPTADVDHAEWRGHSIATPDVVPVRPLVPRRTASSTIMPRNLAVYLDKTTGQFMADKNEEIRACIQDSLMHEVVTQPVVIRKWYTQFFADRAITQLCSGAINRPFTRVLGELFFTKRRGEHGRCSLFTKKLLSRCAWALQQLLATGTPMPTQRQPVATINHQPEPELVEEMVASGNTTVLLERWQTYFKCDRDTWADVELYLSNTTFHGALTRAGINPPDSELFDQIAEVMVSQFITSTAWCTQTHDQVMAEKIIAEHLFYGLPRHSKYWVGISAEQEAV